MSVHVQTHSQRGMKPTWALDGWGSTEVGSYADTLQSRGESDELVDTVDTEVISALSNWSGTSGGEGSSDEVNVGLLVGSDPEKRASTK